MMRFTAIPFLACLIVVSALAQYSGGSGTAQDAYQIATPGDLIALGETPKDYDKHFRLVADIDLDPNLPGRKVFGKAVIARDTDNAKSDFQGTPFTGVFDGNGRRILHLTITGEGYLGLFGRLGDTAVVKDLETLDVNIIGSHDYVGGLVGSNWYGVITQCDSTGAVTGTHYVGELVGSNLGMVTHCGSNGAVSGESHVGGLVGSNNNGTVADCHNTASVNGSTFAGGLAGYNEGGTVIRCYSTGIVSGGRMIGGLVGSNGGVVTQGYSAGPVGGHERIGGLVGNSYGTVAHCYSTGAVSGDLYVGGLVAYNTRDVIHCYSTGAVTGASPSAGGLVGYNSSAYGSVMGCLWDTQTSGQAASAGGTGKATAEMRDIRTYRGDGWDFVGESINGTHEVWQMPTGGGCPVLATLNGYTPPQLQGMGTLDNPYLIRDALELGAIVHYSPTAHYRLATSIDLSGVRWAVALIPSFAGVFDGNGHTISHLTINSANYTGLFGQLASKAEVKNLGVVDVNIAGTDYVGGLVGTSGKEPEEGGIVTQCYGTGVIMGRHCVGGLVGLNYGSMTQCQSTGVVKGDERVGGLIGYQGRGALTHCYSTDTVSGGTWVGGLAGANDGAVTGCYSTGAVRGSTLVGGLVGDNGGTVIRCFWDTQTSGQTTSVGGMGKTTAEMLDPNTFMAAGWDFVGPADGPHDIWGEREGGGYPVLCWQLPAGFGLPGFSGGTGEPNDPYIVSTAEQLNRIGHNPRLMKYHFKLVANLDLTGLHFYTIGDHDYPYGGTFDGNHHTISYLTITGEGYLGLFGQLQTGAEVKDLGVVDVNVAGSGSPVGGLVGANEYGNIARCYSTGVVRGTDAVGGLVGSNNGNVLHCYSAGMVGGAGSVGGLVGYNENTVSSCYSTGPVCGKENVGGLVGANRGIVTQCYSTGVVGGTGENIGGLAGYSLYLSNVTDCLWNTQTSGRIISEGGTGRTTAEMCTIQIYLQEGWDFAGEVANGTQDIWWISEGKDYPRLWWEQNGKEPGVGIGM
jgi:hypothetical protein